MSDEAKRVMTSYSRTAAYKTCPRKVFLSRYQRWGRDGETSVHLGFGRAWTVAAEYILAQVANGEKHAPERDKLLQEAMDLFMAEWTASGLPLGDELVTKADIYRGKTPANAETTLREYINRRWGWFRTLKWIGNEVPFEIPLGIAPDGTPLFYEVKIDSLVEENGQVLVIERKTTSLSSKDGLRYDYVSQFSPNSQVEGYAWAARNAYGPRFAEVMVDVAVINEKPSNQKIFGLFPVPTSKEVVDEWLRNQYTWSLRLYESEKLLNQKASLSFSFPRNEESCVGKYGMCEYFNLCKFVPDPSTLTEPPVGYMVLPEKDGG